MHSMLWQLVYSSIYKSFHTFVDPQDQLEIRKECLLMCFLSNSEHVGKLIDPRNMLKNF